MAARPRRQCIQTFATAGSPPPASYVPVDIRIATGAPEGAADEQQLAAARREIETLRRQAAHHRQKAVLLEQQLASAHRYALHDELTGLPNRRLLLDRFNQALARADRQHRQAVLLFLDLDGFKHINDALGHAAGDKLLQRFARRLTVSVRASDTACRYGGDEFAVLLPDCGSQECAAVAVKELRTRLARPYRIDGTALRITASIGAAVYPDDGKTFAEMALAADLAMYRNKARGPAPPNLPHCTSVRQRLLESLISE
jgi:diguanylate cyclase